MNVLPIIQRELRVASRHAATWRLRLVFACGAVLACAFALLLPDVTPRERGQAVLISLAVGGLILSLFAGAYLTADCVSAEKRDGTLGLLFLTPLNGWQIVAGKLVTHSLQVGAAWLAIFPVFFLPVLHGGVTWVEVARLLLALLTTILLSLACGMLWSTVCVEARTSVLATAGTMLTVTILPWLPLFVRAMFLNRGFRYDAPAVLSPLALVMQAFDANYGATGWVGVGSGRLVYWSAVAASLALGVAATGLAGWLLPRRWRQPESGEPARRSRIAGRLAPRQQRGREPRWAHAVQTRPCRWLASRGAGGSFWLAWIRRTIVGLFALMLYVSIATQHWEEGFITAFCLAYGLHQIERVQAALAVTRRFHDDRRSGALELLLVSPVTEREVVEGHHAGLRGALRAPLRSLLALNFALQAMVVLFPRQLHMTGGEWAIFTAFFTGGAAVTMSDFAALRWLGLREALRATTHLKAAGRAFGLLMVPPWLAFAATFLVAIQFRDEEHAALMFATWALLCLLYDAVLIRRCRAWLRPGLRRRVAEGG